jgi:N-acetyl-gamma-glutamyl-phosphate reductase
LCLPHTASALTGEKFRKAGKLVIELSADFRLRNAADYGRWYGFKHPCPKLLKDAVYGLPELNRKAIRHADLIANPGCYPTGVALGVLPLLQDKLIMGHPFVIDSKSGASGAGKKLVTGLQFCAVSENFYAYKIGRHQHTPEINQTLSDLAGKKISVTFVPHLLPIDRGILTTIYLERKKRVSPERIREVFETVYRNEPFVRVKPDGTYPAIADVARTNYCDVGFWSDPYSNRLVVVTAIDNLLKGASGQAVQNMNIRCGFPEEAGLKTW